MIIYKANIENHLVFVYPNGVGTLNTLSPPFLD